MTSLSLRSAASSDPLAAPGSWPAQACAVVAASLALTVSSHVSVPMIPVPLTLQTLAVTLVGALLGWRLGAIAVLVWLAQGALGLPVLAPGGAPGLARFTGPTGGYLLAFPFAAMLTGALVARGWNGARPVRAFAAMLLGNALCLLLGAAWLAVTVGPAKAWLVGVLPFLAGGALKSLLGAMLLSASRPLFRGRHAL